MYNSCQGVQQDDAEAVKWNRKAAEQGHVSCCVASDVSTKAHFCDLSHAWTQESFKQKELVMHVLPAEVFQELPLPTGAN